MEIIDRFFHFELYKTPYISGKELSNKVSIAATKEKALHQKQQVIARTLAIADIDVIHCVSKGSYHCLRRDCRFISHVPDREHVLKMEDCGMGRWMVYLNCITRRAKQSTIESDVN